MRLASTLELHAGGPGSGCRGPDCGRKPGVLDISTTYHGTTVSPDVLQKEGLKVDRSQRTVFGAKPAISVSDNRDLAWTMSRGELGNKSGTLFQVNKNLHVLDLTTKAGEETFRNLEKDPKKVLAAGYDGIAFKNYEEYRLRAFFPSMAEKLREAKEIQLYANVHSKHLERLDD